MSDPFDPGQYGGVRFARPKSVWNKDALDPGLVATAGARRYFYSGYPVKAFSTCVACGGGTGIQRAPLGPFVLPLPEGETLEGVEVHTLRWGSPDWLKECEPSLDAWVDRHGYSLRVWSEWPAHYADPKFVEVDMLREFLAGESEWMMYVDADVVVHPLAPAVPLLESGIYLRADQPGRAAREWPEWCRQKFGVLPDESAVYVNAGVWVCDRESARRMLEVIEEPYHSGIMEQNHWNWWIHLAERRGMSRRDLPMEWNRMPKERKPSWFFHLASKKKMRFLRGFREAGLLPDHVKRVPRLPEVPDFGEGAVVWPWASGKAEWDELWFSHRSVMEHWQHQDWPLVLFGDRRPEWWPGEFVKAVSYEDALWMGTQCAEQVLWMNDDIFMLRDQSVEDYRVVPVVRDMEGSLGKTMVARNAWRRGLGQVLMRCHHHGKTTLNYSTHTPYLYQREKVREIFDRFGIFYKIPFESAYHNWHATPHRPMNQMKAAGPHAMEGKWWINPAFAQVTPGFRAEMAARFGESVGRSCAANGAVAAGMVFEGCDLREV